MAERMISVKLLDDVTECPICTESYNDPRSLPCIHTFCLNCITKWSESKLPGEGFDCPLCRKVFKIPAKGIEELPKNIFIGKLLSMEVMSNASSSAAAEVAKLCDWCVADRTVPAGKKCKAIKFCAECQESLCERCSELHSKTKMSRFHNTVDIEKKLDRTAAFPPAMCEEHAEKKLKSYCLECREALGMTCFVTKHTGHKSAEVANVASELRDKIKSSSSELGQGIKATAEALKSLQDRRLLISDQFNKAEVEVCARTDELKATIERHKQQLLAELSRKKSEQLKELDAEINVSEKSKGLLESLMKYSEELLKRGSDSDIARESRSLMLMSAETLNIIIATNAQNNLPIETVIKFQPSDILQKTASNGIGILTGKLAEDGMTNNSSS